MASPKVSAPSNKPSDDFLKKAHFIVDSSSFVFRAYYAIRAELNAPDGTPTHATYGFLQMVQALYQDYDASQVILVWDRKEKGFRHGLFPEYKANRSAPPEDLGVQIESIRSIFSSLDFPQVDSPGFEADDCIATLVRKNPGENFVIVTADKDLLQLVSDHVWCLDTLRRKWSNAAEAQEKFGVGPEKIVDVQALCGDSVDNIPGAPGVGPKTAAELINFYGTVEKVIAAARERDAGSKPKDKSDPLKGKRIEAIKDNLEKIEVSHKLVALSGEAPIVTELNKLKIHNPNFVDFQNVLKKLGLQRSGEKLAACLNLGDQAQAVVTDEPRGARPDQGNLNFVQIKSLEEFRALLMRYRKSATTLCLDTETTSLDVRNPEGLVGLSLSFDGDTGYYVPLRHDEAEMNLDPRAALDELRAFLNLTPATFGVVFQNAKFDLEVLAAAGFDWPWMVRVDDSMLASYVIDPNQKHGMDALAYKYLDGYEAISFREVLGDKQHFGQVALDKATVYAAEDAAITWRLWDTLSKKLHDAQLWEVYDRIERPLLPVLVHMETHGVCLNVDLVKALSKLWHAELDEIDMNAKKLLESLGVANTAELNLGSPKQLAKVLFEDLKLPILKKGKTGPSTDVSVLEELAEKHDFPKLLLEWRELQKLISTYVDPLADMIDPRTGRLHTSYQQTIAATGRLSSINPNLQNIPIRTERGRKLRDAFCAQDGYMFVGIDYSQIELRLLAHVSKDANLLKAFRDGADIHARTAALVLGKTESDVTPEDRRMAKAINFGIIYGQTAFGLSKALGISKKEAADFIDQYKKTYPGIVSYMESSISDAKSSKVSTTLTGRKRPVDDIDSKNPMLRQFAERVAINTPLQGTAADLMKAAMIKVFRDVLPVYKDAHLLLQVHDELIFEVAIGEAEDLRKRAIAVLEAPDLLADLGVPHFDVELKTDASIGKDWGQI
ncbi:MAG TPA: DNA polymerase I [Bdellovibrionota bacterium]|jgi:DNA polymerase-1|nr:DNA polymerase I [Bdellovibrionota bacterium]